MDKRELNLLVAKVCGLGEHDYCQDILTAMDAQAAMEKKGYEFKLKDKCPKKMDETLWEATMKTPQGELCSACESSAPMALCLAMAKAGLS